MSDISANREGPPHRARLYFVHLAGLSQREIMVIRICGDYPRLEAAEILNISPHTVKNHIDNVIQKLHANDAANAIYLVQKSGVVTPQIEAEAEHLIARWWADNHYTR